MNLSRSMHVLTLTLFPVRLSTNSLPQPQPTNHLRDTNHSCVVEPYTSESGTTTEGRGGYIIPSSASSSLHSSTRVGFDNEKKPTELSEIRPTIGINTIIPKHISGSHHYYHHRYRKRQDYNLFHCRLMNRLLPILQPNWGESNSAQTASNLSDT